MEKRNIIFYLDEERVMKRIWFRKKVVFRGNFIIEVEDVKKLKYMILMWKRKSDLSNIWK